MADDRRLMMASTASGGIKLSRYEITATGNNTNVVNINESSDTIHFVHFWDADSVLPTNATTYEGWRIGPGAAYIEGAATVIQNTLWRTNSSGATGLYSYGNMAPFGDGVVRLSVSPVIPAGHKVIVDIYHE